MCSISWGLKKLLQAFFEEEAWGLPKELVAELKAMITCYNQNKDEIEHAHMELLAKRIHLVLMTMDSDCKHATQRCHMSVLTTCHYRLSSAATLSGFLQDGGC